MKTTVTFNLLAAAAVATSMLAACGNSNSNNSSYTADSANKANIEKADSANHSQMAAIDSAKEHIDSANKANIEVKEDASTFLVKAFESGMYEIEISQLAAKQATNAEVKKLAAKLVTAHKDINARMSKVALDAGLKLPGAIDGAHVDEEAKLAKMTGADFDKKYMDIIVAGHEKSVSAYKDAAEKIEAGAAKQFAAGTLPLIQGHLGMAKTVQSGLK